MPCYFLFGQKNDSKKLEIMNRIITLVLGDFRQIWRDSTLATFLFIPVIVTLFVRFFVPYITEIYPIVADYHSILMMNAAIQTATMFGFIVSFISLDEKDENVLQVIRVLPISPYYFLTYRLLFATIISSFGAFLTILFGGIAYPGLLNAMLVAIQFGLLAPMLALLISIFAQNKVEGMAYFKGLNLVFLLPILYFLLDFPFKVIFAVIPTFWTFTLYQKSLDQSSSMAYFSLGFAYYLLIIAVLFFQYKKRVFDR